MKILNFNKQIIKVIDNIQKKVNDQTKEALNRVVNYATTNAQNSFDRFVYEVPADDPYVFVMNTPLIELGTSKYPKYSRTIQCVGNQVLFIEFGAGVYYYTDTETRLYQSVMGGLNPRPSSIANIGEYGFRGKDDVWFYKSKTGRESENAHFVKYNRNGDTIMITHGNRPARALYRGVGMALRRLAGGRLK